VRECRKEAVESDVRVEVRTLERQEDVTFGYRISLFHPDSDSDGENTSKTPAPSTRARNSVPKNPTPAPAAADTSTKRKSESMSDDESDKSLERKKSKATPRRNRAGTELTARLEQQFSLDEEEGKANDEDGDGVEK